MKNMLCSILMTLFIVLAITPCSVSQDYIRWGLPDGAKFRLGKGGINEIIYSPDGKKLVVASAIGIWIYNAQTGEELDLYTGHTGEVESVAFSSGSRDGTVILWEHSK